MLHRLVYTSQTTRPLDPPAIEQILAAARTANARRELTGALVFDSQHFLQVLEGGAEPLNALYAALMRDPRHQRLQLLEYRAVERRQFDAWRMAFAAADERTGHVFRRHSASGRLDPAGLTADSAIRILAELVGPAGDGAGRTAAPD